MVVIDDEPTSKRRGGDLGEQPENSVPTKVIFSPSLSAIARSSSLSKPVNCPCELMQMLGGASERVPTVSVPRVISRSAAVDRAQRLGGGGRVLVLVRTLAAAARLVAGRWRTARRVGALVGAGRRRRGQAEHQQQHDQRCGQPAEKEAIPLAT